MAIWLLLGLSPYPWITISILSALLENLLKISWLNILNIQSTKDRSNLTYSRIFIQFHQTKKTVQSENSYQSQNGIISFSFTQSNYNACSKP